MINTLPRALRPVLLYFLCSFLISSVPQAARAQTTISTSVINDYRKVVAILNKQCARVELEDNLDKNKTPVFAPGDRVIIMQMNGTAVDTGYNNPSYGGVPNWGYWNTGNFEYLTVRMISGTNMEIIDFDEVLNRNYSPLAAAVQLIRVPVYSTGAIVAATLTAKKWDGKTGGVLAFEAPGQNVTLMANIDVTGTGFSGGAKSSNKENCDYDNAYYYSSSNDDKGAYKGSGIAIGTNSHAAGRGAYSNGGGGGNNHNSGGGGGGNFGAGGSGGHSFVKCPTIQYPHGGIGGWNLNYPPQFIGSPSPKVFMGGGGGGGHDGHVSGFSHYATPGADGGGIVIIRAGTLTGGPIGAPAGFMIRADGASPTTASLWDGAGGGGGGGAVLLDLNGFNTPFPIISIKGGNGGDVNNTGQPQWLHGPGGGGGGGIAMINPNPGPLGIPFLIDGGSHGRNLNSDLTDTAHGSGNGAYASVQTPWTVPLSEPCRCSCGQPFYELIFEKLSSPGINECCYRLKIKANKDACNLYGIKLSTPDIIPAPLFTDQQNGSWIGGPFNPSAGWTVEWQTPLTPLTAGSTVTVGTFCMRDFADWRTINIEFRDQNKAVKCLKTVYLRCSETDFYTEVNPYSKPGTDDPQGMGTKPGNDADLSIMPNPSQEETTVSYRVHETGIVTIELCNSLGAVVSVLEQGLRKPGLYSVKAMTGSFPAGGYRIRMSRNGQIISAPLHIVK